MSRMVVGHRVIDGRRVDGLEWTVDIGDHAAVTSISGTLAKAEAVGDYPLRPPSAALDEIKSGHGSGGPVPLGAPEARSAFKMDPPGFQLHAWQKGFGVVSHTAFIGDFAGPFPFRENGKLID